VVEHMTGFRSVPSQGGDENWVNSGKLRQNVEQSRAKLWWAVVSEKV